MLKEHLLEKKLRNQAVRLKPLGPMIGTHVLDSNPAKTQPKPILGLEPMWLGLKPGQNPAWDLNPCGLRPNEAYVLDASSHKEFSERQNDK